MWRLRAAVVPEGRATRCGAVLVAAVCVWAAACAQSEPVDGRAAAQPAVGAAEGAGLSDGGVVDGEDGFEGTAEPDGGDLDGGSLTGSLRMAGLLTGRGFWRARWSLGVRVGSGSRTSWQPLLSTHPGLHRRTLRLLILCRR